MRITIHDDNDVVFDSDGKTVLMATDEAQRSFIFEVLTASLAMLCRVTPSHEIPDYDPEPGQQKQ
ncbi:hypothetical protein [Bosea sp. TND4EK4]|uniref:hypothetical protein n=1 Tax=Bosea sp. TND4EK4 TaxID=1907408 RepID=UPI000956BDF8|nr:hypothetical protein [Bosea sp. TND4EK4]SIR60450.1 hypothetical protein SAMN05880592_1383 [Bosea sp. TND4EK4]